jgi:hypothetical protein
MSPLPRGNRSTSGTSLACKVLDDRAVAVAELDVRKGSINQRHLRGLVSDVEVINDRYTEVSEGTVNRLCLVQTTGFCRATATDEDAGGMLEPACQPQGPKHSEYGWCIGARRLKVNDCTLWCVALSESGNVSKP